MHSHAFRYVAKWKALLPNWETIFHSVLLSAGAACVSAHVVHAEAIQTTASAKTDTVNETNRMRYRNTTIDGFNIFYREAGDPKRPAILLLHGFSSSSHMFRDLMPLLADRFYVVAPDYPGFGYSDAPAENNFEPTFSHLDSVMSKFVQTLALKKFVVYMQDFGGPVGLRMAVKHPEWISGLIIQNANAYREGIPPRQLQAMATPSQEPIQKTSTQVVRPEFILYLYRNGARNVAQLNPDAWTVDIAALQKPEAKRIQSALIDDYHTSLAQYPIWQAYFRQWQPKTLIVWGKNDQGFSTEGAEAYRRDLHDVDLIYFDTGHFALEEDAIGVAQAIRKTFAAPQ